ncbi:hypothetical protein [Actinomyces israelii]|uniref:hypothetical protein n=1 Tax=Actinomyces israelii TaxID=1659 RepID=UPI000B12D5B2|nr:hypothetical protein [Actinomyces israelii]
MSAVDVLLVENETDLAATRGCLSAFGLRVTHCPDAESALRPRTRARRRPA